MMSPLAITKPAIAPATLTNRRAGAVALAAIVLAFGLPLALGPLVWLTGQARVMGKYVNSLGTKIAAVALLLVLVGLNAWSLLPFTP